MRHPASLFLLAMLPTSLTLWPTSEAHAGPESACSKVTSSATNRAFCYAAFDIHSKCKDAEVYAASCLAFAKHRATECKEAPEDQQAICKALAIRKATGCGTDSLGKYCHAWLDPDPSMCSSVPPDLRTDCADATRTWATHYHTARRAAAVPGHRSAMSISSDDTLAAAAPPAGAGASPPMTEEQAARVLRRFVDDFSDIERYVQQVYDHVEDDDIEWLLDEGSDYLKVLERDWPAWCDAWPERRRALEVLEDEYDDEVIERGDGFYERCNLLARVARLAQVEYQRRRWMQREAEAQDAALATRLGAMPVPTPPTAEDIDRATGAERMALQAHADIDTFDVSWIGPGRDEFRAWLEGKRDEAPSMNCFEAVGYLAVHYGLTTREAVRHHYGDGQGAYYREPYFRQALGVDSARPLQEVLDNGGLQPGDVVFFQGNPERHTAIALGGDRVVSLENPGGLSVSSLSALHRYGPLRSITVSRNPPLFR